MAWVATLLSIVRVLYSLYQSPQFKALLEAAKQIKDNPELRDLFDDLVKLFQRVDEPVFFEKAYREERYAPLREQTGMTSEMARTLASMAVMASYCPCDDENCDHDERSKQMVVAAGLPPIDDCDPC